MEPLVTAACTRDELRRIAKELGLKLDSRRKAELIELINNHHASNQRTISMTPRSDEPDTGNPVDRDSLRARARDLGIKSWWNKSKQELEDEIRQEEIRPLTDQEVQRMGVQCTREGLNALDLRESSFRI